MGIINIFIVNTLKREPSIHIKESDLISVMGEILGDAEIEDLRPDNIPKLVNNILLSSKKYSINNRNILVTNDKLAKSAKKILKSSTEDSSVIARIIFQTRKSLSHRGIVIAKPGTKDWGVIKDIASNALEFCNDFALSKEEGFKIYIKHAIKKMAKFTLMKIASMHSGICEDYGAFCEIERDRYPQATEAAYKRYNYHIINQVGQILTDYKTIPIKYLCFVKVAEKCKELQIPVESYIDAQFEGLEWAKGIPDPLQLVSEKGNERLQAYLFKHSDSDDVQTKVRDQGLIDRMKKIKKK